ncbi:MAG: large-conductance mechanosensitive channel protein MscL [Candidatus Kapabacteria bacterium]|nr:large-conductance mechanosensitive channel protein MscL [Candidatus Kapabacteria bacterium]
MKLIQELKEFAVKGNVLDLAVAVIIGGAFGKIITSVVNDIIMPPIGVLVGGLDFKDIKIIIKEAVSANEKIIKPAVSINIGNFLQTSIDFVIVAFCIFVFIKMVNKLKDLKTTKEAVVEDAVVSQEILLLTEIRDLLKK